MRMTRALVVISLVVCTVVGTVRIAAACDPATGRGCEGAPSDRLVTGRDGAGHVWAVASVPAGSALLVGYEPPTCTYRKDVEVSSPDGTVAVEPRPFADGSYVYTEQVVDSAVTNQDIVDRFTRAFGTLEYPAGALLPALVQAVGLYYTPLADTNRRFHVGCKPPGSDGVSFAAPYGGFVDVGPWDPVFGLREQVARMRSDLQLATPSFVAPQEVNTWGGLVVRYPAWLSVTAGSWATQTSAAVSHNGWSLQLVAVPRTLNFSLDFTTSKESRDRYGAMDWLGVVGCLGTRSTRHLVVTTLQAPIRPNDHDLEFAEPGVVDACVWAPPAAGQVVIQPTIAYDLLLIANGTTEVLPTYYLTGDARTFDVGELRSVNIIGGG